MNPRNERILRWALCLFLVAFALHFVYRSYRIVTDPCTELVYPELRTFFGLKAPPANCPKQTTNESTGGSL